MATITTTTNANPFQYPGETLLTRHPTASSLMCLAKLSTADNYGLYKSTDNGNTWSLLTTIVRTNIADVGAVFADAYGWLYWAYRTNESSLDKVYLRVINITSGAVMNETLLGSAGNGGTAGSYYSGLSLISHYEVGPAVQYFAVAAGTNTGSLQGVTLFGATGTGGNTPVSANGIISGTRQWLHSGTAGRVGPALDIEHTGNGYSGTPNLWLAYGRTHLKMVKVPWTGAGWSGSSGETTIYSNVGSPNQISGSWDGSRFMMCVPDPVNTSQVMLFQRDRANSTTTTRRSLTHPTGVVRNCTFAYDPSTGNVRIWAVGTSTSVLYQCDWTRASNTFSAWGSTGLTPMGTNADNYGSKRSSNGDAKWGLYSAASGAPNTLTYTPIALSYNPNTPTWVSPTNGAAANVGASLTLTWAFSDPDPGDTQSAYAISRQIGTGTLSYWNASTSTWVASEVQNTSSSSALTLASGWGVATDPTYTYKVKVWDANSNPSGYSAGLMVIPSTPVNPTITSPTAAQVIGSSKVTVVWTVAEQTQYRVQLAITSGAQLYDSGFVGDTVSTSFLIPVTLTTGISYTITLTTSNAEGLPGTPQTRQFSTNFTPPASPTVVATPFPNIGVISVTITNPAPSGAQPALATQDLYRRPITTGQTPLNSNPFFETDVSGWATSHCTFVRSTAQAHQGSASGLVTPDAVGVDAYAEITPHVTLPSSSATMRAAAWIRPATANKQPTAYLRWYDGSDVFISATVLSVPAVAGAWLFVAVEATPPANAAKVSAAFGLTGTPAATDTASIDEARLLTADTNAGVRVGTGLISGATVNDHWAVSGVAYEYRVLVNGTTGVSTYGAWTP